MAELYDDRQKKKWFLFGAAMTATLFLPLIWGLHNTFRGISEQKATGLGAVAGGVAESFVIVGLLVTFVLPIGSIVLLVRSFSSRHPLRSVFSVLCIFWNGVVLLLAASVTWLMLFYLPRTGR